jgi:hypothetical protein
MTTLERDYLILDGNQADISGDYLRWNINSNLFKNWKKDQNISMRMIEVKFDHTLVGLAVASLNAMVKTDLNTNNQSNTNNGDSILGIQNCNVDNTLIISNQIMPNAMSLNVSRFNSIGITFNYLNTPLVITVAEKNKVIIVLELRYTDGNN